MKNTFFSMACFVAILLISATSVTAQDNDNVSLSAYFQIESGTNTGRIFVQAEIGEDWNMYSSTTPAGGPLRTKFTVLDSNQFKLTGDFEAHEDPHVKFEESFSMIAEEFKQGVTWSAPIQLAEGASADALEIDVRVKGQSCSSTSGVCTLINENLSAGFDGELESPEMQGTYEPSGGHVIWTGFAPKSATAGETFEITLTAEPTGGYKIYGYESESQNTIAQPTRIVMAKSNGCSVESVSPMIPAEQKRSNGELQKFHKDEATWTMVVSIPANAEAKVHHFEGYVAFQNCTDTVCDAPSAAKFAFDITIGESIEGESEIGFTKSGRYSQVAKMADRKVMEATLLEEHK